MTMMSRSYVNRKVFSSYGARLYGRAVIGIALTVALGGAFAYKMVEYVLAH
jgi:hypothetical protein